MTSEEKIKKLETEVAQLRTKMAEVIERMNQLLSTTPSHRKALGESLLETHCLDRGDGRPLQDASVEQLD